MLQTTVKRNLGDNGGPHVRNGQLNRQDRVGRMGRTSRMGRVNGVSKVTIAGRMGKGRRDIGNYG